MKGKAAKRVWDGRDATPPRPQRFCYNVNVLKNCPVRAFFFLALLLLALSSALADQSIPEFILKLEQDFASRRLDSYLDAYIPELRLQESHELSHYLDELGMDSMALKWANKSSVDPAQPVIFLQVIYQNPYAAFIETWQLKLQNNEGRWQITEKNRRGKLAQLYKLELPAERVETADRVEITHVDFKLTFRHALIFYDNIPNLETAVLVMGDGHLVFTPSHAGERQQLELLYKNKVLEDRVSYAFVRFSQAFFENIFKSSGSVPVSAAKIPANDYRKAGAIFAQCRSRYFTIQSPLSQNPLTFLPQGEEAIVQFRGKKTGDMAYVFSPLADEEITLYDITRERFINLYSPGSDEKGPRLVVSFVPKYDVEDYQIELNFMPQSFSLSARAKLELRSQVEGLDTVKLRLQPALEIVRIYDGERRELLFSQDTVGRIIYVYLLEPVEKNERTTLEVFYRGRLEPPPQLTDTALGQRIKWEPSSIANRFETFLFSQSAQWYPQPVNDDFFTARLKIIVPPGYSAISNGVLVEKSTLNGVQRVTEIDKIGSSCLVYETKRPVKYLSFLVGKFSLTQESSGPPPLAAYASSDVRSVAKNILGEAGRILEFYESRFGPFPFENLRIVQRLWSTAGGHSPASFIILNDLPRIINPGPGFPERLVSSPSGPVDLSSQWKEYFLAHEIAHQWWGQGVSWARYKDQWLSEGLSQYASLLYLRSKYGDEAGASILKKFSQWTEKKSHWGPITMGSRLSFTDYEAYQAIVYNKTSVVLDMLRDLLGDDVFFSGLKEFFAERKFSAAATGHFKRVMETVSGRDLQAFFRLWFDSYLLPNIRAHYTLEKGRASVTLKIRLSQLNESFAFPLWVSWEDETGVRRREKLIVEKKQEEFVLELQTLPHRLELNPDKAVPGKFLWQKG